MLNKTKILFVNINGFNPVDLLTIKTLLDINTYDLFIIQETWFAHYSKWKYDPYLFSISLFPEQTPVTGHISGGLAIFGNPSMRQFYETIKTTRHSIVFKYTSNTITTSYQPPSRSLDAIKAEFQMLPKSNVLIGDFNYRMGPANNDNAYSAAERRKLVYDIAQSWNLFWCKPMVNSSNPLSSRTDHCFSSPSILSTIQIMAPSHFNFITDHNVMDIELFQDNVGNYDITPSKHINQSCYRLRLKNLKDKEYCLALESTYNQLSEELQLHQMLLSLKQMIQEQHSKMSRTEISALLDEMNMMLTDCIWEVGEQVLGCYEVKEAKTRKDSLLQDISNSQTNTDAVMMFKRANRGNCSKLKSTEPNGDIMQEANQLFGNVWKSNERTPIDFPVPVTLSDFSFSDSMIEMAITRYPNSKSCGIDGIHIVLLKALLNTKMAQHLEIVFDACLMIGVTPSSWNEAISVLIPKKSSDCPITESRPISLTLMFRRLFEICLSDHLESSSSGLLQLHQCQAGGRKGYSTVSNVLVLDELGHHNMPYTVLLDIKKGFDSVRHLDLLTAIESKSSDSGMNSLLFSMFMDNMRTSLVVNGYINRPLSINRGIFQGSVLSPLLFNVWIDDLVHKLNDDTSELPKALAFIDDLVLKCSSDIELKRLLLICEEWSISREIQFNTKKCFVLKAPGIPKLTLYDEELPIVDSAMYLGVPFTSKGGLFKELLENQLVSVQKTLGFLNSTGRQWPEWVKLQLLRTFVLSKLNYCSPITGTWLRTSRKCDDIEKVMADIDKKILHWLFNTNLDRGHHLMRSLVQVDQIENLLKESVNGFFFQIQKYAEDNPWHSTLKKCKDKICHSSMMNHLSMKPQVINQFKTLQTSRQEGPRISFQDFMKKRRHERLNSAPGILQHYIMPRSRKDGIGVDQTLYHNNDDERKLMLDWRRNLLFTRKTCPVCNVSLNRGHINDCLIFEDLPPDLIQEDDTGSKLDDQQQLLEDSMQQRFQYNGHYNILDTLLNNGKLQEFIKIVKIIQEKLQTQPNQTGLTSCQPENSQDQ